MGRQAKLILIQTKQPPTWEEWNKLKSRRGNMTFLQKEEGQDMKKKKERTAVVIRRGKSSPRADESSETVKEFEENTGAEAVAAIEDVSMPPRLAEVTAPPEAIVASMSRPQFYNQVTAHILGDCAVQHDSSGVYDVLARNFADSGMISWWLHRIGHGDMTRLGRRKDLFDYLRLVSNALHRELKRDLGRPVARI